MEEKAKQVSELLKVLANKNRLLILCALMEGQMTVGELLKKVDNISQSALSQHLNILKAHGILDFNKNGQNVTYFIHDHKIEKIINVLQEHYC